MKNNFNRLDYGALMSLAIFLILNILMWSVLPPQAFTSIMRSCAIAIGLYLVPVIIAQFKIKFAYHFLGFIIAFYTFSFVMTLFIFEDKSYMMTFRILICLIAIIGIVVNLIWYRLLFKSLKSDLEKKYNGKNGDDKK